MIPTRTEGFGVKAGVIAGVSGRSSKTKRKLYIKKGKKEIEHSNNK